MNGYRGSYLRNFAVRFAIAMHQLPISEIPFHEDCSAEWQGLSAHAAISAVYPASSVNGTRDGSCCLTVLLSMEL